MTFGNNIFKEWDITNKEIIDCDDILNNNDNNIDKFLNSDTYNYNNLEKLVFNISKFHIDRLNINDNASVRYKIKSNLLENKLQFTNIKKINPFVSCFLFLNDSNNPYIFTDIEINDYKYKKCSIYKNGITICFPRKLKYISVENYNTGLLGEFEMFEKSINSYSNVIIIDIFKDLNDNILKIADDNNQLNVIEKNCFKELNFIDATDYNDSLLEDLIYTTTNKPIKSLADILLKNEYNLYNTFVIKKQSQPEKNPVLRIGDSKRNNFNININKYIQRFLCKQIYNKSICEWIVNEIESYSNGSSLKFNKSAQINYPGQTITIDKISAIFSFILYSCTELFNIVKSSYCIDYNFNIKEIFVLRYTGDSEECIESATSSYPFTINILLKNENENNTNLISFDDGINLKLNVGDMIIHTNRTPHNYIPIKAGCIYSLIITFDVL